MEVCCIKYIDRNNSPIIRLTLSYDTMMLVACQAEYGMLGFNLIKKRLLNLC